MVKRRDLVSELERAGFHEDGGTNHGRFVGPGGKVTFVPRHREIGESLAREIRRQAGIRGRGKR